jgi:hypothetical protein
MPKPNTDEKPSQLRDFAALIGSKKGTHPIPPDQYLTYQDKRYSPPVRLWSLFVQCSIAPGHRSGPATYQDHPLTVAIAAKVLKLDKANARAAWRQLEQEKRLRKDDHGQIWIAGDFKLPGGEDKAKEVCTNLFPDSYMKQINKLPEASRAELFAEELADRGKRDISIADAVAAARFIFDQRQNSRLARYGVKVNRQNHKPAKGKEKEKAERDQRVLNLLPSLERYVQTSILADPVQSKNGSVQTSASLLPSENRERSEKKPTTTAASAQSQQQQQQQFDLNQYPLTDSAITATFPVCDAEHRGRIVRAALALGDARVNDKLIAQAIKAATVKDQHSAALYEKTVPGVIQAWMRDADRKTA